MKKKLLDQAKQLPNRPGCYLFLNGSDEILYVGKAKNLKNRVSTYFFEGKKSPRTQILVGHITKIDFIITETDAEAFILENNLIKKHFPKYNVRLKDDKSYPYVVFNMAAPFPRPKYTRRPTKSKDLKVFGPFPTGSGVLMALRSIIKLFGLRDCSLREFKSRSRPCLLYQMHQCSGPCVGLISSEEYAKNLQFAVDIFENNTSAGLRGIEKKMREVADAEKFEEAAYFRDNLKNIDDFINVSKQKNTEFFSEESDFDVVAFYQDKEEVDLCFYIVRNNLLIGHKNFHFMSNLYFDSIDEELLSFLVQYYTSSKDSFPQKIILDLDNKKLKSLELAIHLIPSSNNKTVIESPGTHNKKLYELTKKNAQETQRIRISGHNRKSLALQSLASLLKLKERPRIIECFDIAIWQGKSPTASQIVFHEGKADKKAYRYYHLSPRDEGNNDYAMMKELFERRIKRKKMPDVFIVDGGKGHLSIVLAVLKEMQVEVPVIAIAKSKTKKGEKTQERLFLPGRSNPYLLKKNQALFQLIVSMRDEAHRFSRKLHHKAENERTFHSWFDDIEGIGIKTKQKIMQRLDRNIVEFKNYSEEEIHRYLNVSPKIASRIKKKLMLMNL